MQTATTVLAILCLIMIAWQDMVSRSVQWIWFPLLAVAGLLQGYAGVLSPGRLFFCVGCNWGFLAVQFAILAVYFLVRGTPLTHVIDEKIGWGDIFFLIAAGCFFSPLNFVSFYLSGLVVSLLITLVWMGISRSMSWQIPLAGLQSAWLLMLLCTGAVGHYSLLSDRWLAEKILRP